VKGLSSKEFVVCNDLVLALPNRITAISDGAAATPKQSGGWGGSGSRAEIKFDLGYKVAFVPKIDKATSDLKNTNVRLKDMINQI
uniref:Syntaxin n=1 Tax=Solanum tuberosum TaxID=4113 RepID=M1DRZ6_SOLTU